MAKTSYRMIGLTGILSWGLLVVYCERALPPSTENKRTNFCGGKKEKRKDNEGFRGVIDEKT